MPLPKPPSKKAALLANADYESQAAPKAEKRTLTSAPAAEVAVPLALHDGNAAVAAPPRPAQALAHVAAPAPAPRSRQRTPRGSGPAKLFVLDTNVLMHDPTSLFSIQFTANSIRPETTKL